jgi:hypothetical protein
MISFRFLLGLAAVALAASVRAELIPADRKIDWTPGVSVGVIGGIPTDRSNLVDVTKAPYNADNTGNTDASSAIQAAINAAKSGDVIYLPAGTYSCSSPISTSYKSNITLRGAGEGTVINASVGGANFLQVGGGSDYNWSWPTAGNTITGGLGKGSTKITLADTSAFAVGQIVQICSDNDFNIPVISVFGYQGLRRQMTRVTAKTGTTLSVFPALYGDYSTTKAVVHVAQFQANGVGVEDLLLDMSRSTAPFSIWLEQAYGCWVKNVRVRFSANYHIFLNDSLNCEVRHCYLDQLNHVGTNGAGVLCNTVSGCLVEDNIIYKAFPLIEVNHGSSGNVFAYNFCEDSGPGVAIDSNHGPHNAYNLYEGNIAPNLQADGYFGSASHDTIFRNWFHSTLNNQMAWAISLNRFTRYYSIVGNVFQKPGFNWTGDGVSLGNPNMGNSSYTTIGLPVIDSVIGGLTSLLGLTPAISQSGQTVTANQGIFTPDSVGSFILTPTSNVLSSIVEYKDSRTVVVATTQSLSAVNFFLTKGPSGFQELDSGVAATLIRKGNYYYRGTAIPDNESLGGEVLPASLYRTEKPAWFGDLTWPAFDPNSPNPSYRAIPAGLRYVTGSEPTATVDPGAKQKPINVQVR